MIPLRSTLKALLTAALLLAGGMAGAEAQSFQGYLKAGHLVGNPGSSEDLPRDTTLAAIIAQAGGVTLAPGAGLNGTITMSPSWVAAVGGGLPNVGIYASIANPANGYTGLWNGMQVSLGAPIGTAGQFGGGTVGLQQAFVATLSIAAGDTAGNAGFAVAGYAVTNSIPTGGVGVFGFGGAGVAGTSQWGGNFVVANCANQQCTTGLSNTVNYGIEINFLIQAPSTNSPTRGIYMIGASTLTQAVANVAIFAGIDIDSPGYLQTPHLQWVDAYKTENGAAQNGLNIGALGIIANSGSQAIILNTINASAVAQQVRLQADPGGDLVVTPAAGAAFAVTNGSGATVFETGTSFGPSDVTMPMLTTAGALCNSAAGVVSTTTGKCAGNDPSDVTSVFGRTGAVVAATNDYTVAQVNGAAPLASPTFTGTVIEPLLAGGNAVSSTLTIESTTAAGTSDSIVFKSGSQVVGLSLLTSSMLKFGAASFVANGAVATTVTSLGPTGSHTTIQEWLTVQDSSGVQRWIPAY